MIWEKGVKWEKARGSNVKVRLKVAAVGKDYVPPPVRMILNRVDWSEDSEESEFYDNSEFSDNSQYLTKFIDNDYHYHL